MMYLRQIASTQKIICTKTQIKILFFFHLKTKDIYLHHELFSIENNLLTPTMKSKRNELKNYFQTQIDELYEKLD